MIVEDRKRKKKKCEFGWSMCGNKQAKDLKRDCCDLVHTLEKTKLDGSPTQRLGALSKATFAQEKEVRRVFAYFRHDDGGFGGS